MRDKTNVRHLQPAVGNATLERDISMFFFWNFEIYNLEQKEGGGGNTGGRCTRNSISEGGLRAAFTNVFANIVGHTAGLL